MDPCSTLSAVQGLRPVTWLWVSVLPLLFQVLYRFHGLTVYRLGGFYFLFYTLLVCLYQSVIKRWLTPSPRGIWHCLETFLKVMTMCPVGRGCYTSYNAQDSPTTRTYPTSKTSVVQRWRNSGLNMYFYSGHVLDFLIREKSYLLLKKYPYSS